MKNTNDTQRNLLVKKVNVQLDMLPRTMLNWLSGKINLTDVITIDNGSTGNSSCSN